MDMRAFMTGDPRWMTYQQALEKKWQVRKGEKSTTIFFAKPYEVDDEEAEDGRKTVRVLNHYAVFHASQVDGIPAYTSPTAEEAPWTRPEAADIILKNSGKCGPPIVRESLLIMSETRAFLAAVNIHILEFDAALVLTSASRSVRDEQFLRYSAGCSV
jgi:N-terminal domain of anti-restriction factor ArdC